MYVVLMLRINKEMLLDLLELSMWKEELPNGESPCIFFTLLKVEDLRTGKSKVKKQFFLSYWKRCYEKSKKYFFFLQLVPGQIINCIFRINLFLSKMHHCLTDEFEMKWHLWAHHSGPGVWSKEGFQQSYRQVAQRERLKK